MSGALVILLPLISLLITSSTAIVVAWIGYKMAQLEKNTNSKMDMLITLTATSSRAEGRLEAEDERNKIKGVAS